MLRPGLDVLQMWVFVMVLVSMDPKGTLYMRRGVHKQHLSQVVDITDKHGVMPAVQHTLLTLYRRDKTIQLYHSNNIHWSSVMEQPVLTQVRAQEDIFNKNHVNHSNECSFAALTTTRLEWNSKKCGDWSVGRSVGC